MRRGRGSCEDDREEMELYLHHLTGSAFLVSTDGDDEQSVWVPRSMVDVVSGERHPAPGQVHQFLVPQWLAEEKELV